MMPQLSVVFVMSDAPRIEAKAGRWPRAPVPSGVGYSVWSNCCPAYKPGQIFKFMIALVHLRSRGPFVTDGSIGVNLPTNAVSFEIGFCFSLFCFSFSGVSFFFADMLGGYDIKLKVEIPKLNHRRTIEGL